MSSLLSYHIFSFFISNIFENFKFGRNFSKFTAGMGCRLVAVSVKIGGNRRLPIGKENTAPRPVDGQLSPLRAVRCRAAQACGAAVPGNSAPTGARRPCAHSIPTVGWYRSTAGMAPAAQIFPWGGHPRVRSGGGRGRRTCRPLRNLPAPPAGWAPPRDRYNKGWK